MTIFLDIINTYYPYFSYLKSAISSGETYAVAPMGMGGVSNPQLSFYVTFSNDVQPTNKAVTVTWVNGPTHRSDLSSTTELVLHNTDFLQGTEVAAKTIFLRTDSSVSAQSVTIIAKYDSDTTGESHLLIPESGLGGIYYVVTNCNPFGTCQFAIATFTTRNTILIALPTSHAGNEVKVVLRGIVYTSGAFIDIELEKEQSLQVTCECDLTGTKISSMEILAVFAGSYGTVLGEAEKEDFLIEQFLPYGKWGNKFDIVPTEYNSSIGDIVTVLADNDNTRVSLLGHGTVNINKGQWFSRIVDKSSVCLSSKPVSVTLFKMNRIEGIVNKSVL